MGRIFSLRNKGAAARDEDAEKRQAGGVKTADKRGFGAAHGEAQDGTRFAWAASQRGAHFI